MYNVITFASYLTRKKNYSSWNFLKIRNDVDLNKQETRLIAAALPFTDKKNVISDAHFHWVVPASRVKTMRRQVRRLMLKSSRPTLKYAADERRRKRNRKFMSKCQGYKHFTFFFFFYYFSEVFRWTICRPEAKKRFKFCHFCVESSLLTDCCHNSSRNDVFKNSNYFLHFFKFFFFKNVSSPTGGTWRNSVQGFHSNNAVHRYSQYLRFLFSLLIRMNGAHYRPSCSFV